jgi:hypothetical protein
MSFTPKIDSLSVNTTSYTVEKWSDSGPMKLKTEGLLRGGSAVAHAGLLGRVVKMSGIVRGANAAAYETSMDALYKRLQTTDEIVIQIADDRYLDVYCEPGPIEPMPGADGIAARWSATFTSKSPYWRSSSTSTQTVVNSSATVSVNCTNAGQSPAQPTFQVVNGGASDYTDVTVTVKNGTTNDEFRLFQFDLAAGDTLYVDSAEGQVYVAATAGGAPSASSGAPKRVDGLFWDLANGVTSVSFEHNFGTASDITFKAIHHSRYPAVGDFS